MKDKYIFIWVSIVSFISGVGITLGVLVLWSLKLNNLL